MESPKTDLHKVLSGFQIALPTRFRERYGLEIDDVVEVVELGGTLIIRPVTLTRQEAKAELDAIFAEADAISHPTLTSASEKEISAMVEAEIKAHRQSLKRRA